MVEATFYWIIGIMTLVAGVGLARALWAMAAHPRE